MTVLPDAAHSERSRQPCSLIKIALIKTLITGSLAGSEDVLRVFCSVNQGVCTEKEIEFSYSNIILLNASKLCMTDVPYIIRQLYHTYIYIWGKSWPNGRESDSKSKGCEFESWSGRDCCWGSECTTLSPLWISRRDALEQSNCSPGVAAYGPLLRVCVHGVCVHLDGWIAEHEFRIWAVCHVTFTYKKKKKHDYKNL